MKRFSVLISIINFKSTQSPMNAPKLDVFPFYFNLIINRYLARKKRTFLPLMSTFLNQNSCRGELWVLTFVSFIQGKLNVQKRANFLFFVLKILMTFFQWGLGLCLRRCLPEGHWVVFSIFSLVCSSWWDVLLEDENL